MDTGGNLEEYVDLSNGTPDNEVVNASDFAEAYMEHEFDEDMKDYVSKRDSVYSLSKEFERMDTGKVPTFSFSETSGTKENPTKDNTFCADISGTDAPVDVSKLCIRE